MNLKKILRFMILVSLPFLLVACSSSSGMWSSDLANNAAAANTDISIGFLGQVFGTVGSVIQGNNNQMLGQLFYQFNLGVLMLIGVWLIYTILTAALRGANEGSFQGQGKNVAYNCLKIGLGVALVLPNPSTGYNLFQEIMMDVTVAGVHLADNVWNSTLEYLKEGHALWVDPSASQNQVGATINAGTFEAFMGASEVNNNQPSAMTGSTALGYNVMQAEVCMLSADTTLQPTINTGGSGTEQDPWVTEYVFPGSSSDRGCGSVDWSSISKLGTYADDTNKVYAGSDQVYGSLCTGDAGGASIGADVPTYCQEEQNAVGSVVYDVMPAASIYYCNHVTNADEAYCGGYTSSGADADIENDLYLADIDYTNNIYGAYDQKSNSGSNDFSVSDGEKDGWMMAGRYYWDMTQQQQATSNQKDLKNYVVAELSSSGDFDDDGKFVTKNYMPTYLYNAENMAIDYANALDSANKETSSSRHKSSMSAYGVTKYIFGGIVDLMFLFSGTDTMTNPIQWLTQVGQACIAVVGKVWFDTAVVVTALAAVGYICSGEQGIGFAITAFENWMTPFVLALCAMLMAAGCALGYYVPLYPYAVFTFGTIAWFIAVIEAMAAAPLVAFGLTHPEGHDFLGKAEQAVMLALSVFLRPALMVIGLVAGMILSFVAFKIVNYTFCNFMQDLFRNNHVASKTTNENVMDAVGVAMGNSFVSSGSLAVLFLSFPVFLVIFAGIVMEVTHQCYSLIYVLPDYVMRWLGAPNTSSPVSMDKMTGAMKGAISETGSGLTRSQDAFTSGGRKAAEVLEKGNQAEGAGGSVSNEG